ncbi:uncharacterized protein K460DRAFT_364448 [Cucurbitaria berberidis CBS 394.84]|uniref:Putative gamma-glutamylcyclotransferase n=1 Tax=Cucurbitaria berberidis CBS 394.84 TaxID=1168544 RepID=A0A9P4GNW3_9PLEO|nr:uncharacterized protein K460DRAFT_364448 [Cucurbitaria berberidis CBS 394.84]KAF1848456.1 hypothetical protein K460DRAFT_364448 [Cucurbitaria berberidis CBS 394.84]
MDYFDGLDQEALDAFGELNHEGPPLNPTTAPTLSSATKQVLQVYKQDQKSSIGARSSSRSMKYLFKLNSPITPAVLSSAAILPSQPEIIIGEGEDGIAQFCQVNERDIPEIKSWLTARFPSFCPIFAPINKAYKELSPFSAYPTLGVDTTMPHLRPQSLMEPALSPAQDQYPVWYFFYGTLANSQFLAELFCVPEDIPVLFRATVSGGKLRTWGKKYQALVNSPGTQVDGCACKVMSRDQEDALLVYETAKYEVVRVPIVFKDGAYRGQLVRGCTFRFSGEENELDDV